MSGKGLEEHQQAREEDMRNHKTWGHHLVPESFKSLFCSKCYPNLVVDEKPYNPETDDSLEGQWSEAQILTATYQQNERW